MGSRYWTLLCRIWKCVVSVRSKWVRGTEHFYAEFGSVLFQCVANGSQNPVAYSQTHCTVPGVDHCVYVCELPIWLSISAVVLAKDMFCISQNNRARSLQTSKLSGMSGINMYRYFCNIPTYAHTIYTLKNTKLGSMTRFHSVKNTRHKYRRIVMTYGRKPHISITNVYQQI